MKLAILFLLATLFSPFLLADERDQYQFGLRFNPHLAWLATDTDDDLELDNDGVNAGFSFGVQGDIRFAENYFFATELRITRGFTGTMEVVDVDEDRKFDAEYDFNSVEIPLGLKMRTPQFGYFDFFGRFSLIPGVYTERSETLTSATGSAEELGSEDLRIMRAAFEITLGTNYQIAESLYLKGGLAYNHSMFNLVRNSLEEDDHDLPQNYHWRMDEEMSLQNHYMALNLGVLF